MRAATGPTASAAWILARATALTDPRAAIAFRTTLTAPGRNPRHVTQLNASGGEHHLAEALTAGRFLVIASDGAYPPPERERATTTAAPSSGSPSPPTLPGTTLIRLTTPSIANATTQAVQQTKHR
ncbi:hypothetical protein [Streptomyces carpaticus]|uniref:hypothetical protein n=1 Tax=Streptomyces carpaticus TaxID=285558 RepID=UPI0031F9BE3C